MRLDVSPELELVLQPLTEALPLDLAMPDLLPKILHEGAFGAAERVVEQLKDRPLLQAAIWLYVDDLERSHDISQTVTTTLGAYWHGIMHRREGDFWNAKYWFRQAGRVPFYLENYEPSRFVDECELARPHNHENLVRMQRQEWAMLFEHCARV